MKNKTRLNYLLFLLLLFGSTIQGVSQCPGLPTIISLGSNKDPDKLCSPVTAQLEYSVRFASNLLAGNTCDLYFFWGDGTATVATLTPGNNTYTITRTKAYPLNSDCEYTVNMILRYNGNYCSQSTQIQKIPAWRTDAFNGGNVQLISPISGTTIHEVCEGQDINVVFNDESVYNCNANYNPLPNPPNDVVETPNTEYRWQQIIYNTPIPGAKIPNVSVNGIPVTGAGGTDEPGGANYQDPRGVFVMLSPVVINDPRRRATLPITAPGGFGAGFPQVGNELEITIRYWNYCNPYSNNGPGFPPVNGDLINGDNPPVERVSLIRIIDAPPAPSFTPNPAIFCNNQSDATYNFTANGTGGTYRWYRDAALTDLERTGATFNPVTQGTPAVNKATAGNYTYYLTESLGNGCTSDPTPVNFTIRNALGQPPPLTGPTDVCPNTTYTWTVPVAPAVEPFGGATEYIWTIPAGWVIVSQNATSITLTTNSTIGGSTLSVRRRYTTTPNCQSNVRSATINIRANPTANISPDPINLCQGSSLQLNGNPTNSFGAISNHIWTGDIGILDDANTQQPTILASAAPGSYNLTYTVTNSIGCSGSDNVAVNIYPTPTTATAGADQNLCQPLTNPSGGLGGNTPVSGTGQWSQISGPGLITFNPTSSTSNATATANVQGIYVVRWTISTGGGFCSSFEDVQLDFGAPPATPDAGPTQTVCGTSTNMNGTAPTFETGTWSVITTPPGGALVITNVNSSTTLVSLSGGTVYGTYTLRWRFTSGTCTATEDFVDITFNPPATSTPMASFTTCVDPGTLDPIPLTGTVGGGATGGRWERVTAGPGLGTLQSSGTAVGSTIAGATINDAYVPTSNDFSNGTVELRLVASGATAPCPEVSTSITVTFDRKPTIINAGPNQPLLCADAITGLGATTLAASATNNGGTGTWSGPAGITFGNVNSPTSTVGSLPVGTNTLTWTVASALGVCAPQVSTVDITVNPLPLANDPAPSDLCETNFGTGIAVGANLTAYHDAITGIAGSTNRTITWYSNLPRIVANEVATPTSFSVSNGQILYTRVTNTLTNCSRDGQVTFTINPLPVANNQTLQFCEEFPSGSNQVNGIDLTAVAVVNGVTGGAANRAVTWFNTQAGAINNTAGDLVASPNNLNITGNRSVFARVRNTVTGCINVSQVDLIVKPRPATPIISGSSNQCTNGFGLYSITPVGSATYIWTIDPAFDLLAGGGANEFIAVLGFPTVATGDVKVKVVLNGCESVEASRTVTVQATPPTPSITASKSPVCENETGIVYTATSLPNTDYTWVIPGTTGTIIGGQGSNQVTVNIGSISGNIEVTPQTQGGGCAANTPATFFIDIKGRPTMDTYAIKEVCSDNPIETTFTVTGTSPPTNSFNITNVTIPPGLNPSSRSVTNPVLANEIFNDSYTNTTGGNLDVRYTVVPVSTDGCEGAARDIFLRIKPEPTLSPNLSKTICSREATNITLVVANNSISADQFEIVSIITNGLTASAGNPQLGGGIFGPGEIADDAWINTSNAPVTVTYNIRPINSASGCIGDPPFPVQVVVNPEPVITTPLSETICSATMPINPLTSTLVNSTFTWTVLSISGSITGPSNGSGPSNSPINNILTNNAATQGSVVYRLVATGPALSGSCTSQPVDITVLVDPAPLANNVDQIVCSDAPGGNTFTVDLESLNTSINSGGGLTFKWYQDAGLTTQIIAPQVNAYPLANGIPVFVEIDNGQCVKIQPVTYSVNPSPSVSASITSNYNGFELSCNGSSNGQITASAANGTTPFLYSIDGGTSFFTSTIFNGLSASGNPYIVRVRDAKGCIADATPLNFTQPPALMATPAITSDYNGQAVSCQGAQDGVITVTTSGGTGAGTYSYQILELPGNTTGNTNGVYTGLGAGSYTFVVRDINNCQITTSTITITNPPIITATATLTNPVSCNGGSDGEITVTAVGGTLVGPNYTFTLNQSPFTSNSTGVFTGLATGSYTVTVRDDNNCSSVSNTILVTQPATLTAFASITSNYNGAKISCPGANDAQITISANGGNGGYTYVLDQIPGNVTGQTDGSFEGLGPGTYTITVTDSKSCNVVTASVTIAEPQPIVPASAITNSISCNGSNDGQITISASGGTGAYTFTQLPATSNTTGIFSGLAQGTYDFLVTDANGCSVPIQRTINQPTIVTGTASVTSNYNGSQISCNGVSDGVITINASGGNGSFTYEFDQFAGNTTGQTSGIFTGVPVGTGYTFTVRDAKNCTVVTVPINVSQPSVVTGSGVVSSNYNGQHISCIGASDGAITITPGGGTGGTYTFVLDQNPSNTTGNSSGVYTGLAAGSYTVTVRDVNNCFVVTSPIVVSSPTAVAGSGAVTSNYNGRQISCNGASDGVITLSPSGGVSPYTFTLNEIPTNVSGQANGIFIGIPAGTFTFTIQDANGCNRITTPVSITEPAVLAASASVTSNYNGEQISCNGFSDGTIKITTSGGTTAYSYTFNEIPANTTGQANGTFTGIPAGTSYSFTVTDVNSCIVVTVPIDVSQPPVFNASAAVTSNYNGVPISCNGVNDGVITVTTTGGTGVPTYSFDQFAGTNQTGKFSGIFSSVPAGNGYTFTARDVNNCTSITVALDVVPPPALTATGIASSNYNGFNISCFNLTDGEITITGSGGTGSLNYLVLEDPGNASGSTSGVFNGLRAGNYRVRVTDVNNCALTTTVIPVTQPTDISISLAVTSNYNGFAISCFGASDGAVSVSTITGGAGGYEYILDQIPTNTTGQNPPGVFTGIPSGVYSVTVTDDNNCTKQSIPVVLLDPLPLFEGIVGLDKSMCVGQDDPTAFMQLAPVFGGIGNYAYQWLQSTDNVSFSPVAGATATTYDPPASLTQTTYYKRQVNSGSCTTLETNVVKVTVNPLPTATLTPSDSPVCEGEFFLLNFEFTGTAPFRFDYNDGAVFTNDRLGANTTPVPVLNYTDQKTFTLTKVRDFNGCLATSLPAPVTIPVIKINPNFVITSPAAQCGGSTFTFEWNVDPDVEYTWYWNDGPAEVIPANSLASGIQTISHVYASVNPNSNTTIPITLQAVNTAEGCGPKNGNKSITLYPNITLNVVPDKTEICSGETVRFTNSSSGGTSHRWYYTRQGMSDVFDERNRTSATTENFVMENTYPQNPIVYEMHYDVNNGNCSDSRTFPITVYKKITADFNIGAIPPFNGFAVVDFTNTSNPIDDSQFDYAWDFGSSADPATQNGVGPYQVQYNSPGSKTIRLIVTNEIALAAGLSCTSTRTQSINIILPPLVASFDYDPLSACFPSNIRITNNSGSGADDFEWQLFFDNNPNPILVSKEVTPTFSIVNPGVYTIRLIARNTATSQTAFADNFATPINIYPKPTAAFQVFPRTVFLKDDLRVINGSFTSGTATGVEYRWNFGDTNTDIILNETDLDPTYSYLEEGRYIITLVVNEQHPGGVVCSDTVTADVVARDAGQIQVPNAFTPNPAGPNDGTVNSDTPNNDVFLPIIKGNIKEFQMQIFDRWGNMVFESRDQKKGWNGYDRNGNLLPAGVYVFKLDMLLENNKRATKLGDVTMIR
jgi:gliding motility-associated-like protein